MPMSKISILEAIGTKIEQIFDDNFWWQEKNKIVEIFVNYEKL